MSFEGVGFFFRNFLRVGSKNSRVWLPRQSGPKPRRAGPKSLARRGPILLFGAIIGFLCTLGD